MIRKKWLMILGILIIGLILSAAQVAFQTKFGPLAESYVYDYISFYYYQQGAFKQALPWAEKSVQIKMKRLGDKHIDTLASMANLAEIYRELGNLSNALFLAEKSYFLRTEVLGERHTHTIHSLNILASIYRYLERLDDALPLYEKGYRVLQDVLGENSQETLTMMINLGVLYKELEQPKEGLPLLEKGYRLSEETFGKEHNLTLYAMNNLATIYGDLGESEKALRLLEKGYPLTEKALGKPHPLTLKSLTNLAEIYHTLGQSDKAWSLSKKSYPLFKEVRGETHPDTLRILGNLAFAYARQNNFQKAIEHLEELVAGVEQWQNNGLSLGNRRTFFKQWVPYYTILSAYYIQQSRTLDAFRIVEMTKARTLLESLAVKHAAQHSGLTKTEQQQLREFDANLSFLNNRIAKASENNHLTQKIRLENEKNQLVNQFKAFHQALIAKYPKYAQLSKVQIVGVKEGAKLLPADAVLISYFIFEDKANKDYIFAFTLQSDGTFTGHNLGKIPNLKENIEDYRHRLSNTRGLVVRFHKNQKDIKTLNHELGKHLLEPLKSVIKDKPHWIISPIGPLALVPFETLRFEGEEAPVVAQHQMTYVQSLSVLKLLQERGEDLKSMKKRGTLLAMGAPIYETKIPLTPPLKKGGTSTVSKEGTSIANPSTADLNIARRLVMQGGDYERAFRQLDVSWRNLPGALKELSELEQLFKDTQPAIYKQTDATEVQLQRLNADSILDNYRYLVFSTHGYLSTEVPALSSIVLGQVNNPPKIDGYVTASEWTGYNLKSDLMVLSACDTGVGSVVSGEGVMGLPYAFYVAGNKNTLLTLWAISDQVTAEFIASFFRKLKMGVGQIEALTTTKREFIEKGYGEAYWAAFVLYGV